MLGIRGICGVENEVKSVRREVQKMRKKSEVLGMRRMCGVENEVESVRWCRKCDRK